MTVGRGFLLAMDNDGVAYPGTVVQFAAWFPDDSACLDYLAWLRWGDAGFSCYLCGALSRGWARADGTAGTAVRVALVPARRLGRSLTGREPR